MDWKITLGLGLTFFTFAFGAFINRNMANERNLHEWINKIESRTIQNSENVIRILGMMEVHELEEHRSEKAKP